MQPEGCHLEIGTLWQPALYRQAARVVGLLKLFLSKSLEGKRCSMMGMATVLAKAAQVVNSCPIA